ncbi:MAG TPA: TlyA family RNA methyltransferase [Candidatus Hydrogenedentes bacterium]|nr:TlyA family RNA methyltransferase [Candidatus Hydrogenedentota bacterium]
MMRDSMAESDRGRKERLDWIVQQRMGITRTKAQALVRAGSVLGPNGEVLDKPGLQVVPDIRLDIRESPRYVSRGGFKLEEALSRFQLDVRGRIAIDVGASTGGFTDCLLQHGAARVYAVDVGYGQLAWSLRQDDRVVVLERTNIRHLDPSRLPERPAFFTADCSFISLQLVLPSLKALLAEKAQGVVLIKPQFEAGRAHVGKGGVVRDEAVRAEVVENVLEAARRLGFASRGVIPSSLLGPAGNREFLAHLVLEAGE